MPEQVPRGTQKENLLLMAMCIRRHDAGATESWRKKDWSESALGAATPLPPGFRSQRHWTDRNALTAANRRSAANSSFELEMALRETLRCRHTKLTASTAWRLLMEPSRLTGTAGVRRRAYLTGRRKR